MKIDSTFLVLVVASLLVFALEAKTLDPYKVLGVEKNASQREIQKAFHKLSLQYHPDKNKIKGAQEKFAEINNAYEILSGQEKRKNYDLYGDEKGNPGFGAGNIGDQEGYTYFTSGGPGQSGFSFRPDEWQNMGGSGRSQSFSFSGGSGGQRSSGFGLYDISFSFFEDGMGGGGQSEGFSSSSRPDEWQSIRAVNSQVYKNEILDKGVTWFILSYTPTLEGTQHFESLVEEVANSLREPLRGALQVGSVNCETESLVCKELGIHPRREPKIFVYSYVASNRGSLVEFYGDLTVESLKTFCQDHLLRFSKRVDLSQFDFSSSTGEALPKVMLVSTKKDTPAIWRVLSGWYHKRIAFYDAKVHDASDPTLRRLGVGALPAVVGWLSNGEKQILSTGSTVTDTKSAVQELSALRDSLHSFEKKNKKAASSQAKKAQGESGDKQIPLLAASNIDALCGETTPVCIIGAFRSLRAKDKLQKILLEVSQKPLTRRRSLASSSGDSISHVLLDASKHPSFLNALDKSGWYPSFLNALDKSGFKSSDKILIAYKPRKGKYAAFDGEMNAEEVERFVGSVLNGDVKFTKTRQKPTINSGIKIRVQFFIRLVSVCYSIGLFDSFLNFLL